MYLKLLKNDFRKNPGSICAIFLFMLSSVTLTVTAVLLIAQLFASIQGMYQTAKPPHFLQMHKGSIRQKQIDDFNEKEYDGVLNAAQTVTMIDVYGENLSIQREGKTSSLSECRIDIGLVKQNESYDLLLDENGAVAQVNKGEIGIPVILLDSYDIRLGDYVVLEGNGVKKTFLVTTFVRDGQMNSTMCSSTRILLNDKDFDELRGKVGEEEYLIEAWFADSDEATHYQTEYENNENLPKNGQAITYKIMMLLSALTDIMMAMVLLVVGVLLIVIAFICLKYTIMATLEEELTEIGTMKAIGIRASAIRGIYLGKMRLLMAGAAINGFFLSFLLYRYFTGHMARTFGKVKLTGSVIIFSLVAGVVVYMITIGYCKKILNKIKKVTVVDALVREQGFARCGRAKNKLHRGLHCPVNLLAAIQVITYRFSDTMTVLLVMFIAACITIIPWNLISTMEAPEFAAYMGSNPSDVLIELEQGKNLEERKMQLEEILSQTSGVSYAGSKRLSGYALDNEKNGVSIQIDCGQTAGDGLKYLTGNAPKKEGEIALSKLEAEALAADAGETITVYLDKEPQTMTVSGIYQDLTSGGMTAKAYGTYSEKEAKSYSYCVNHSAFFNMTVEEKKEFIKNWRTELGSGYRVELMEDFIGQTLGDVVAQVKVAARAAVLIGIFLTALIIGLFLKLRLSREASQIAVKKAIGFGNRTLRLQETYLMMILSGIGILTGALLANGWGDYPVSALFAMLGMGIEKIEFFINPLGSMLLLPGALFVTAAVMAWRGSRKINQIKIVSYINE